jgi:DNA-binding Xre family transcriptional regulator
MSTKSNNLEISTHSEDQIMVPLTDVAYFSWDKAKGDRVREIRGKVPRRELAKRISEKGLQCSQQYIQKIEDGNAEAVAAPIVIAICECLDASIAKVITPAMKVNFMD